MTLQRQSGVGCVCWHDAHRAPIAGPPADRARGAARRRPVAADDSDAADSEAAAAAAGAL
jgi:hypothetical protein